MKINPVDVRFSSQSRHRLSALGVRFVPKADIDAEECSP